MPRNNDRRLTDAQRQRDEAFRRVSRVRRMTIIGAGALTAAAAAAVSAAAPGHTLGARQTQAVASGSSTAQPGSTSRRPRMPPLASAGSLGLQSSDENSEAPGAS